MTNKVKKIVLNVPPFITARRFWNKIRRKDNVHEITLSTSNALKQGNVIDKMVSETRLEYLSGKTKGFTDTKKLIEYLES